MAFPIYKGPFASVVELEVALRACGVDVRALPNGNIEVRDQHARVIAYAIKQKSPKELLFTMSVGHRLLWCADMRLIRRLEQSLKQGGVVDEENET
jgi:hypothetical protein